MRLLRAVSGKDPILIKALDQFEKSKTVTQSEATSLIRGLNSSEHNLRPGDSGRNRSLKARFDSGVVDSKTRKRGRSPSPVSKRIISEALEVGEEIRFYAPDGVTAMSSVEPKGISTKDLVSSLSQWVKSGKVVGTQEGSEFVLKRN